MLEITKLRVMSFDLDYLDVLWEIYPTKEDIFDYDFYVERSDNEYSGFVTLAGPFRDMYYFRDTTIRAHKSFFRTWYYRLKVVHRNSGTLVYFPAEGSACLRVEPDLEALYMAKDANLRLQRGEGRLVWIFPIRTFGQKCGSCTDSVTGRRIQVACPVCFNSTYVGGYHNPIEAWMKISSNVPIATSATDTGEVENVNTQGRLGNWPEVSPRWLVVTEDNKRWRIGEGVRRIEKGRSLVSQSFSLHAIPVGDIEYKLPINLTLDEMHKLQTGFPALYTNAQDVAAVGNGLRIEDMRKVYGC